MAEQRIIKPGDRKVTEIERFLYHCCAMLADIKKDHKRNAKPWYKYDRLHWNMSQLGYELGCVDCKCVNVEEFKKEL